jgi:hypothetical protein
MQSGVLLVDINCMPAECTARAYDAHDVYKHPLLYVARLHDSTCKLADCIAAGQGVPGYCARSLVCHTLTGWQLHVTKNMMCAHVPLVRCALT